MGLMVTMISVYALLGSYSHQFVEPEVVEQHEQCHDEEVEPEEDSPRVNTPLFPLLPHVSNREGT